MNKTTINSLYLNDTYHAATEDKQSEFQENGPRICGTAPGATASDLRIFPRSSRVVRPDSIFSDELQGFPG